MYEPIVINSGSGKPQSSIIQASFKLNTGDGFRFKVLGKSTKQ